MMRFNISRFMRTFLCAVIFAIVSTYSVSADKFDPVREIIRQKKINVILILADDLGWGDIGYYGSRFPHTPNIDSLAEKGATFTNFYVASPVCSPSRVGFMTGIHPSELGIHATLHPNIREEPENSITDLPASVPTLTSLFASVGYRVGHFGKWHLGSSTSAPPLADFGIDTSYTYASRETPHEFRVSARENINHFRDLESTLVDKLTNFIGQTAEVPFFANLWFHVPHTPVDPTEESLEVHSDKKPYWPRGETKSNLDLKYSPHQIYHASITDMDRQIGRLISFLKEKNMYENTLIIFSSDNGPQRPSQPTESIFAAGNTGPFRGNKAGIYEGGTRVPFIVSLPSVFAANYVDETSHVSALDLYATFFRIFGQGEIDERVSGEDVLSAFVGEPISRDNPIFHYYRRTPVGQPRADISPVLAIRQNEYKLLMNPDGSRIELYDTRLTEDPFELTNLAGKDQERVNMMSARLLAWYDSIEVPIGFEPFGRLRVQKPHSRNPIFPDLEAE